MLQRELLVSNKKWSFLLVIFFLIQNTMPSVALSMEGDPLNPLTSININNSDQVMRKIYDAICLGVFLYELDVVKRLPKEEIEKNYPELLLNSLARFDIKNMDLGKKGWTRYYPFSVGDKSFIMRIFLTSESAHQPSLTILYEGTIASPAVTFQVLPPLNDILSDCKIKPRRAYSSSEVNHSL